MFRTQTVRRTDTGNITFHRSSIGNRCVHGYVEVLDLAFETYARWLEPMQAHFRSRYPKTAEDSDQVYRSAIRAKALDTLRGLLPAAVQSNVGLYGTGQAYEALLLRMRAHPLAEYGRTAT